MPKALKLLKEIGHLDKDWSVKLTVLEKSMPRLPRNSSTLYQRLVLCDSEGSRIQATIFGDDIDMFSHTLTISKTYYISNADVRPILPKHRIVNNDYQWTIKKKTLVQEVKDNLQVTPAFTYVPFGDMEKYKDCLAQVDVVAIAIKVQPSRKITTTYGPTSIQEIVLINQELKPMILTMWGQFVNNEAAAISKIIETKPVIIGLRLKVVKYNGISLSTKSSTSFIINPNTLEAAELQTWSTCNEHILKDFINDNSSFYCTTSSGIPKNVDITDIRTLQESLSEQNHYWVKASIIVINIDQDFFYMSCNNCNKFTSAEYGDNFECIYCKHKEAIATPRCRLEAEVKDNSGSIIATIFGRHAETLLSCSANKLMEHKTEDGFKDIKSIATLSSPDIFNIHIKSSRYESRGQMKMRFNVLSLHNITTDH